MNKGHFVRWLGKQEKACVQNEGDSREVQAFAKGMVAFIQHARELIELGVFD